MARPSRSTPLEATAPPPPPPPPPKAEVLAWLRGLSGTKTLLGQFCGWATTLSDRYLRGMQARTGKRPMYVTAQYETPTGVGELLNPLDTDKDSPT